MKNALFEKALSLLNLEPDSDYRILDFGCGTGDLLGAVVKTVGANSRLVGYDAMEKVIAISQDATRLPNFSARTFPIRCPSPMLCSIAS